MTVLWLAFGIYILGIAIVLFLRPNAMFRPGAGTWKEFGLNNTGNYTVFPFWMFTMIWALLSYVFATLGAIFFASLAIPTSASTGNGNFAIQPISSAPAPKIPEIPTIPSGLPAATPGYYILQPTTNGMQYVYFGTSPPTLNNLVGANSG